MLDPLLEQACRLAWGQLRSELPAAGCVGGSTATVAVVAESPDGAAGVSVLNCGDSRALLFTVDEPGLTWRALGGSIDARLLE